MSIKCIFRLKVHNLHPSSFQLTYLKAYFDAKITNKYRFKKSVFLKKFKNTFGSCACPIFNEIESGLDECSYFGLLKLGFNEGVKKRTFSIFGPP